MKKIIEELSKFDRQLLGAGYDNAIEYIKHLIDLEVVEIPSGTKLETWTVPDEWIPKEAWVRFNGKKIIEWKDDLSLLVHSRSFKGEVNREELKAHLYTNKDRPNAILYETSFYERKWGFCVPYNKIFDKEGKDLLKEGKYEVFIDTEFKPSTMKIGVHTIPGKYSRKGVKRLNIHNGKQTSPDREILLFAHLDHPYQANDNLSGVACLIDIANKIKKKKYNHTIKIVFCPETIGSMGYVCTQDISKVDFMVAVDICGSDSTPKFHWSYNAEHRINRIGHLAMMAGDETFNMDRFRSQIGSDEYAFNDPQIGIQGLLLTRHPYPEYHTSDDTIDIIKEDKIKSIQKVIHNIIEIYEKDFIPVRNFRGPLFRTKYNVQTPVKNLNLALDYFIYSIDGKKYLSEIIDACELNWQFGTELIEKLIKDKLIKRK